ncbi:hypothetical protein ACFWUU_04300 [Kribbella sp. NPDC058693]|uniref:hypothetical protein n=1 Tax=Kribbella sp. NPDC058693 TaxID=3346602 RepID=UPI003664E394
MLHNVAAGIAILFELDPLNSQLLEPFSELARWNRSFGQRVDETFLLLVQLAKSLHGVVPAAEGVAPIELECLVCFLAHGGSEALRHLDSGVESYDCGLYPMRRQMRKVADAELSSPADEVSVHPAVTCRFGVHEARLSPFVVTLLTAQYAAQVVSETAVSGSWLGAHVEDGLYPREDLGVNDGFVTSGDLLALKGDESEVVGVGENGPPLLLGDWLGYPTS